MKRLHGAIVLAAGVWLTACAARVAAPLATYGSPPTGRSEPLSLERALTDGNLGQTVAVRARAAEVCQMKGCWMVLSEGSRSARVTFRDYAFFVPKDLAGKTVVAEGVLSRKTLTVEEAEHLASESGNAAAAPSGQVTEWSLIATSVAVLAAD